MEWGSPHQPDGWITFASSSSGNWRSVENLGLWEGSWDHRRWPCHPV